jgi:RNA polymerase sigma-70 factor (ECF subfamily)
MVMPPLSRGSTAPAIVVDDEPAAFRARIVRVVAGDVGALGELFVSHGDLVHRTAYRLTGNRADADDVTQELFVRLPLALQGFNGGISTFSAWIRRVAVRQALMLLRAGRRRAEVSVDDVASLVAARDQVIERLTIEDALARLSDEHRTVFLLKEVEGFAHSEIAELLDISVANSEVRLHRARRELRALLGGSR